MLQKQQIYCIAIIGFLLNLIWESLHVRLYVSHLNVESVLLLVFIATVGDVLLTFVAIWVVVRMKNKFNWPNQTTVYLLLAVIGLVLAFLIEKFAFTLGWWEYKDAMPIIPYLKVGLSPLIQLTILIPLAYGLSKPVRVQ